jgi:hypothetical protein
MTANTTTRQTVTLTVTAGKEAREVSFDVRLDGDTAWSEKVFAARIGHGVKVHRTNVFASLVADRATAKAKGWNDKDIAEDEDGLVWVVSPQVTVRNRTANVVGWADAYEGTKTATKQSYYGTI